MPSGAKKRKAAKKKKEQAANTINSSSNNNNPHGNDDPRSQDERDSDGGDVGSPASSQDGRIHQHPFSQGEQEQGKTAPSPAQSYATEDKSVEEATREAEATDDGVAVKFDRGLEPKEDVESIDVSIQHVAHDKSSSSSSTSSSDDESRAFQNKSKEEANYSVVQHETLQDVDHNFAGETVAVHNLVEPVLSVPEKVVEHETLQDVDRNSAGETAAVHNLVEPVLSVPEKVDHAAEISVKESVVSDVVDSGFKESEDKLLPSSNGTSRVEYEVSESKISPSSTTPAAASSNVAEENQDSVAPDYSEKQPLVASTPPVVQRTSVFSCCGLFDVFSGSGR